MSLRHMDNTFSKEAFLSCTETRRQALCDALGVAVFARLSGAPKFHDAVMTVVNELRELGHDLWGFDADDDFEIWCPNYVHPTGPGLVILFRQDGPTDVQWSTAIASRRARIPT